MAAHHGACPRIGTVNVRAGFCTANLTKRFF